MTTEIKQKSGLKGVVELIAFDKDGNKVDVKEIYSSQDLDDVMPNQTLNTAKQVLSRLVAGDTDYAIAKMAFGNAGHNFDNTDAMVPATQEDTELRASELIKASMNLTSDKHFTYTHTLPDSSTYTQRLVYIEKDISPSNISYGENDEQLIITVPIDYTDFNYRVGGASGSEVMMDEELASYDLIDGTTNDLMTFKGVNSSGVNLGDFSEIQSWDDNGTRRYTFKNGLDASKVVDSINGGKRPIQISEILLCTGIIGDGSTDNPYKKLGTSRVTMGLINLVEGLNFELKWTLSWNHS